MLVTAMLPMQILAVGGFHRRHFFGGVLFLLLILILIALGITLLVRLIRKPRGSVAEPPLGRFVPPPPPVDPVLSELRLRYARGEISREEYLRRAADLGFPAEGGSGAPPWPPSSGAPAGSAPPPWPSAPGGYPSPPSSGQAGS